MQPAGQSALLHLYIFNQLAGDTRQTDKNKHYSTTKHKTHKKQKKHSLFRPGSPYEHGQVILSESSGQIQPVLHPRLGKEHRTPAVARSKQGRRVGVTKHSSGGHPNDYHFYPLFRVPYMAPHKKRTTIHRLQRPLPFFSHFFPHFFFHLFFCDISENWHLLG